MATGELRTSLSTFRFVFTDGSTGYDVSLPPILVNFNITGTNYIRKTQTVGTVDSPLDLGDIVTPGYLFIRRTDPAESNMNIVSIGEDGSSYPVKLIAADWCLFRFNGSVIHIITDLADCVVEYFLIEE